MPLPSILRGQSRNYAQSPPSLLDLGRILPAGDKPFFFAHGSPVSPLAIKRAEFENQQQESKELVEEEEEEEEASGKYVNSGKFEGKMELEREAWRLLNKAVVTYCGSPVGTVAAEDPSAANEKLNYDQVIIRDFVPSAIEFQLNGETEIVRNFLLHTLQLQSWEKTGLLQPWTRADASKF